MAAARDWLALCVAHAADEEEGGEGVGRMGGGGEGEGKGDVGGEKGGFWGGWFWMGGVGVVGVAGVVLRGWWKREGKVGLDRRKVEMLRRGARRHLKGLNVVC